MKDQILKWLTRKSPPNYLFRKPFAGALILFLFIFLFGILYQPLDSHPGRFLNYWQTAAVYAFAFAASVLGIIKGLRSIRYFSGEHHWTILKELTAIFIALTGMGITAYFLAFIVEEPAERWNLATFADSFIKSFLIGLLPFMFFTSLNLRYWFVSGDMYDRENFGQGKEEPGEELIKISSRLKKEELSFFPHQFIYATSDSNYVNFYLSINDKVKKEVIRNSISDIEQQLSKYPYLFRTHRAFIVNVRKISKRKGNVLGYRLKLAGIEPEIPVSRNKTGNFNKLMKQFNG
jgi:hypothetical protein